jgi:hypothetical protein
MIFFVVLLGMLVAIDRERTARVLLQIVVTTVRVKFV